jgi:hypothetical protein
MDPTLGLCTSAQLLTAFGADAVERHANRPHGLLPHIRRGWELLDAPDVADALRDLQRDPTSLVNALARFRATLARGDPKRANVGFGSGRVVLIDRQLASVQPPAVDLAWFLQSFAVITRESKEAIIGEYFEQLAARLGAWFNTTIWEAQLRLALRGQCVRSMGMWLSEAHYASTSIARDMRDVRNCCGGANRPAPA